MTSLQKSVIIFLSVIIVALVTAIGTYAFQTYRAFAAQPLGPALPFMPTQGLPPTWTASPGPSPTSAGQVTLVPTFSIQTATSQVKCGGPMTMNLLVIGADTRGDNYTYGLADAIRLLRVDFATPKVTMLEFPRALWVEIPHIADDINGQDHELLNQSYLYGNPGFGYWDDPSGGPGLLSLTLNKNFGAQIDHYVAVNMRTFVHVINAVGGIEVRIPNDEIAHSTGLKVGINHLDGDEALKLARNRSGGIFERGENQNMVLCGLRDKLASSSIVASVPALIESFHDNILTDLTPEQLGQLACISAQMPPENIVLAHFPDELFTQTRIFDPVFDKRIAIVDADFNILRDYVARFHAGTWPLPVIETPSAEEDDAPMICE